VCLYRYVWYNLVKSLAKEISWRDKRILMGKKGELYIPIKEYSECSIWVWGHVCMSIQNNLHKNFGSMTKIQAALREKHSPSFTGCISYVKYSTMNNNRIFCYSPRFHSDSNFIPFLWSNFISCLCAEYKFTNETPRCFNPLFAIHARQAAPLMTNVYLVRLPPEHQM